MKNYIKLFCIILPSMLLGGYLVAADAPKADAQPANSTASRDLPTVKSLTEENEKLKAKIIELEEQVRQLNIATAKLQDQRDNALNTEVMRAMAPPKK